MAYLFEPGLSNVSSLGILMGIFVRTGSLLTFPL